MCCADPNRDVKLIALLALAALVLLLGAGCSTAHTKLAKGKLVGASAESVPKLEAALEGGRMVVRWHGSGTVERKSDSNRWVDVLEVGEGQWELRETVEKGAVLYRLRLPIGTNSIK